MQIAQLLNFNGEQRDTMSLQFSANDALKSPTNIQDSRPVPRIKNKFWLCDGPLYKCIDCKMPFTRTSSALRHFKDKHYQAYEAVATHVCSCGMYFLKQQAGQKHVSGKMKSGENNHSLCAKQKK